MPETWGGGAGGGERQRDRELLIIVYRGMLRAIQL